MSFFEFWHGIQWQNNSMEKSAVTTEFGIAKTSERILAKRESKSVMHSSHFQIN